MTPCKQVCKLDENMWYCTTCYRTIQEIGSWSIYTDKQKYAIMNELELRKKEYESSEHISRRK